MNTEKETLQRVQGALYHLRRGLAPFVEARMKARHGAQWLAYASRANGGDPRGALDEYGLLKTMIDNWRDAFDEAFGRNEKHRVRNFTRWRSRRATRPLIFRLPIQDNEALRYLDAIHQLLHGGKGAQRERSPSSSASMTSSGRAGLASPPAVPAAAASPTRRAGADGRQAGQGVAAVDRSGAAAPRRARQPLQGGGVRRRSVRRRLRQRRGRLRDAAGLLRHHLPDRGAEARP